MERLTTRCNGQALMAWEHEEKYTMQEWIDILTDRLAAYEDTGLTPEEIKDTIEMFHSYRHICAGLKPEQAEELAQAKKDERLVVLPCKLGDTVYTLSDGGVNPKWVAEFMICHVIGGSPSLWAKLACTYESKEFIQWTKGIIGKTVFLSLKEAEEALKNGGEAE